MQSHQQRELPTRRNVLAGGLAAAAAAALAKGAAAPQTGYDVKPKAGEKAPTVRTRMFWTWDHSTEWALNRPGAQTIGACNPYFRGTDTFIEDYTKLLNWCGRHHVDAVVVWGLLRDGHGGVDAVKRLCTVAMKNNVRLLCGVGLAAYGGVYYEGASPYSMANYLAAHPQLYAVNAKGERMTWNFHACPSRPENQQYVADSLEWLFKTLPLLGGVQMETGDTGTCQCALCRARRKHPTAGQSWEDMALMYPIAGDAIRSVKKDAWMVCETYTHPEPHPDPKVQGLFGQGKPPWADEAIAHFPKGQNVFVQWVADDYVKPKLTYPWTDAGTVSNVERRNIMRAHFGTYWVRKRGELAVDWIADMVSRSVRAGVDAISLFGEVSPFNTNAELNYLALENYGSAANPRGDLGVFLGSVVSPLLGGAEAASKYLRLARLVEQPAKIAGAMGEVYAACDAAHEPEMKRRWIWLANYLASYSPQA